jgi:hypothetical protein
MPIPTHHHLHQQQDVPDVSGMLDRPTHHTTDNQEYVGFLMPFLFRGSARPASATLRLLIQAICLITLVNGQLWPDELAGLDRAELHVTLGRQLQMNQRQLNNRQVPSRNVICWPLSFLALVRRPLQQGIGNQSVLTLTMVKEEFRVWICWLFSPAGIM